MCSMNFITYSPQSNLKQSKEWVRDVGLRNDMKYKDGAVTCWFAEGTTMHFQGETGICSACTVVQNQTTEPHEFCAPTWSQTNKKGLPSYLLPYKQTCIQITLVGQTQDLCCLTKVGPYKFPWEWRGTRKCETILLCDGWVDDCWQTNHYSCNRLTPSSLLFIRQTVVYKQFRGGHVYDAQEPMLTTMVHWDTNLQGTNATNKTCPDYSMHTNCMRKSLKSAVTQHPSNKHNKWHTHTLLHAYTGPPNDASVR